MIFLESLTKPIFYTSIVRCVYLHHALPCSPTHSGIYVKAVIAGGIADQDGRVEAGDQILSVNENSLIDCTQQQ